MNPKTQTILILATLAAALAAVAAPFIAQRGRAAAEGAEIEQVLRLAGTLRNEGQLQKAIEAYQPVLQSPHVSPRKKSNLCYLVATALLNEKRDYEGAHAWFVMARHYDPNSENKAKINEGIVEALERTGRSLDAQNKLRQATALRPTPAADGPVIAKVGEREITSGELREALRHLDPGAASRMTDRQAWSEFVRNYARIEQLKNAATRAGIHKEPDFVARRARLEDQLLAQEYLQREVRAQVDVSEAEARLYYKEHPEEFTTPRRVTASYAQAGTKTRNSTNATTESAPATVTVIEGQDRIGALGESKEAAAAILKLEKAGDRTAALNVGGKDYVFTASRIEPASMRPFEQSQRMIVARLRQQKEMEGQEALFEKLNRAEPVVIYDERITTETLKSNP